MESTDKNTTKKMDMGSCIAIGMGLGVAGGIIFDQLALGIALGVAFGVMFGSIFDQETCEKK